MGGGGRACRSAPRARAFAHTLWQSATLRLMAPEGTTPGLRNGARDAGNRLDRVDSNPPALTIQPLAPPTT